MSSTTEEIPDRALALCCRVIENVEWKVEARLGGLVHATCRRIGILVLRVPGPTFLRVFLALRGVF